MPGPRAPKAQLPAAPRTATGPLVELAAADLEDDRLYEGRRVTGDAPGGRLRHVDLAGCVLAGAALPGSELTAWSWVDVEASTCDLQGVAADRLRWLRVAVSGCRLTGATMIAADLQDSALADVRAPDMAIRGSKLRRVSFTDSSLAGLDLADSELAEVRFTRCDLTGARMHGARMRAVSFLDCDLSAVTGVSGLAGSSIDPVTLQSAAASLARGLGMEVGEGAP